MRDMRGELEFLKCDRTALSWAFGCVLASLQQRVLAMLNPNNGISRPVLILEWLMCFAPLTVLWAIAVTLIVSRSDSPPALVVAAVFGTLGPIALIVSLIATTSTRKVGFHPIARLLVAGCAMMILVQVLSAIVQGKWQWFQFDFGTFVLLSLLPLLGALHFERLTRATQI